MCEATFTPLIVLKPFLLELTVCYCVAHKTLIVSKEIATLFEFSAFHLAAVLLVGYDSFLNLRRRFMREDSLPVSPLHHYSG